MTISRGEVVATHGEPAYPRPVAGASYDGRRCRGWVRDGRPRGRTRRHRQRPAAAPHRRRTAHHRAGLAARPRAHRGQGGVRRGGVRRLLGAGRPPRRRGVEVGGAQRLPRPGGRARRTGGGHGRGPRDARGPAPRPARAGRPWGLAVRVLHARVRGRHGRGVLPPRPGRGRRRDAGRRARTQRLRPAGAERQPVPLHRLPADPGRGLRPRDAPPGRPPGRAPRPTRAAPRSPPGSRTGRVSSTGRRASPTRWPCSATTRRRDRSPAAPTGASRSTSAAPGRRTSWPWTASPSCASSPSRRRPTVPSRSAPRSPSPRSSASWRAACRC